MVNLNKIYSFKVKRQAKNVFPSDVDRIVVIPGHRLYYSSRNHAYKMMTPLNPNFI